MHLPLPNPVAPSRIALVAEWSLARTAPGSAHGLEALSVDLPWLPATCPGTVAGALLAADPAADLTNASLDAWDWWYRGRFQLDPASRGRRLRIRCEGLATLAELWFDGERLGVADNQFTTHTYDPTALAGASHELLIRFRSLDAELALRRPRPRWRVPMLRHQQLRHVRATLLGRTPGWSPPFPAIGPWRPIEIECADQAALEDVRVQTRLADGTGIVEFSATSIGVDDHSFQGTFNITGPGVDLATPIRRIGNRLVASVTIQAPSLWWPHTHGEPTLYQPTLRLQHAGTVAEHVVALPAVGFRRIRVDRDGGGFSVVVNDVPVFCRGACWTPLDPATLTASPEAYEAALDQAVAAGMNLLRVGGTMIYEEPAFYAAASRRGILVWQDFMFANMDYPTDEPFVASVRHEVNEALARFGDEACLAVLCGNSEAEQQAAMWGAPRSAWQQPLFHEVLPALCASRCPDVPYWPSSAHGGDFSHQANQGTSSYYGVGAYLRPLDDARRSELRFATEALGFANVPEPTSLHSLGGDELRVHAALWKARSPRDLGAGWDFDDVRDHYLRLLYGVDPLALRAVDHARYLALSRVVSADVMAAAFAEWRRAGSACRGALVWFLRDLWAGAGWGVVAADGAPKAAWYGLQRALQPVAVFFTDEGVNGLDLHVVNERALALVGRIELRPFSQGRIALKGIDIPVTVPPRGTVGISVAAHVDGFIDFSYAYRFGAPPADVIVATLRGPDEACLAETFHLPAGPLIEPRDLELTAAGRIGADGGLTLELATDQFARSVRIDVEGAVPTDNYFHLAPDSGRRVQLRPLAPRVRWSGSVSALNGHGPVRITWTSD